ncbi:hypothetical protein T10_11865 [Trichinella papuae]|uniref:Uncharacterized protein n=1 Tax=Trichinella papuae TaxID=268474 RepID=A0A0V1N1K1_9BILA|nr:hypothetical protein T10_11865 [Trichinella papuae]
MYSLRSLLLNKEGCKKVVRTNLEGAAVNDRKDYKETFPVDEHLAYKLEKKAVSKKRNAEETKSILTIYDEEASVAFAEPSTSGHFLIFKWVKSTISLGRTLPKTS